MSDKNNVVVKKKEATNNQISIEIVNRVTTLVQRIVYAYEYEISTQEMDTLVALLIEALSKTCEGLKEELKKIEDYELTYGVKSSTPKKNKKTSKTVLNEEALNQLLQDFKSKNIESGSRDYLKHFYTLAPLSEDLEDDFPLNSNQNSSVDAYHFMVLVLKKTWVEMNNRLTEEQAEAFFTAFEKSQLVKVIGTLDNQVSPNLGVNNLDKFKTLKQKIKEDLITWSLQLKKGIVANRPSVASKTLDPIVAEQLASNEYVQLISATQLVLHNTVVLNSEMGLGGNKETSEQQIDTILLLKNDAGSEIKVDIHTERTSSVIEYTKKTLHKIMKMKPNLLKHVMSYCAYNIRNVHATFKNEIILDAKSNYIIFNYFLNHDNIKNIKSVESFYNLTVNKPTLHSSA